MMIALAKMPPIASVSLNILGVLKGPRTVAGKKRNSWVTFASSFGSALKDLPEIQKPVQRIGSTRPPNL